MRVAALVLAGVGVLLSLYVTAAANKNLATTQDFSIAYIATIEVLATGVVLASFGVVGAALTWRSQRLGPWLLVVAALGWLLVVSALVGFCDECRQAFAWPWRAAGIAYLLAAAVSFVAIRSARAVRSPRSHDDG